MPRLLPIVVACLALAACAAGKPDAPRTYADYSCEAESQLAQGSVRVVRWLGPDGALSATVVIWMPAPARSGLSIMGRWQALPPQEIDLERGLVMFDQTAGDGIKLGDRVRYRLELRASSGPDWDGDAKLVGRFPLEPGVRLSADWADVAAMARGAGGLRLILRNRRSTILSETILDRALFEGFASDAEKLLKKTKQMMHDFRARCESSANGMII